MDTRNLLLVVLGGFALWSLVDRGVRAGTDGGGGDHDRGLIAVTGTYGSGASALYLIDTKTRHLAVYRLDNGRALDFVAARDCSYDFLLETYNDETPAAMKPGSLRRSWQEFNQRGGENPAGEPADGAPKTGSIREKALKALSGDGAAPEGTGTARPIEIPLGEGGKGSASGDGGRKD